jgi:hypothetical protein
MRAAGAPPSSTIATTIERKLPDTLSFDERMLAAIRSLAIANPNSISRVSRSQFASGEVSTETIAAVTRIAAFNAMTVEEGRRITGSLLLSMIGGVPANLEF